MIVLQRKDVTMVVLQPSTLTLSVDHTVDKVEGKGSQTIPLSGFENTISIAIK